jgi:hypothetical protein
MRCTFAKGVVRIRSATAAACLGLAAVLGVTGLPAGAAETSSNFNVTVKLGTGTTPPETETGFCRRTNVPGAFGAAVTVVCSTGAVVEISPGHEGPPVVPMHGGAYRFLTLTSGAGVMPDSEENFTGLGTVTSWRVVHLSNRDFLELTVRW